jgi:hypothetical protein
MSDEVDLRPGESEMITFERVGRPTPPFRIEPVGEDPDIRYQYHWANRGQPTPEQFERVGHLEVKLVAMLPDLDDEQVRAAADDVHDAIVQLKSAMANARDLDDEQRQDIAQGNLDGLPEVERSEAPVTDQEDQDE